MPDEGAREPQEAVSRRISAPRAVLCGLAMGTADAIPGVSGGTIALILGIYERFIASLGDVVGVLRSPLSGERWRRATRALRFLAPLGAGVVAAYYVATKLLVGKVPEAAAGESPLQHAERLLAEPPPGWLLRPGSAPIVFAFFFGLVLMSVNEPWRTKASTKPLDWLIALLGAAAAVGLSLAPPGAGSLAPLALVGAGAVAISVMLLPGVSGSLALLVLGMYQPVSGAVHERDWATVAWFALGIVTGIVTFVPLLRAVLRRAHDRTMSFLSGLMLGSLAALWPWKAHYLTKHIPELGPMSPEAPFGEWWWPVLSAVGGAALIVTVSRAARSTTGSLQAR